MGYFFAGCSTETEWKQRYRQLAKKFHPDVPGGNASTFQAIAAQYEAVKSGAVVIKHEPVWGKRKRQNRINKLIQVMQNKTLKPGFVYNAYRNLLIENRQAMLRADLEFIALKLNYRPEWVGFKCRENNID